MSVKLKQMRENRAKIGAEIRRMADTLGGDKKDFNAEERAQWEKVNKDYDELGRQIAVESRAAEVAKAMDDPAERPKRSRIGRGDEWADDGKGDPAERRAAAHEIATQAWFVRQSGQPLSKEQVRACKAIGFNPNRRELSIRLGRKPGEVRALSVGTAADGGHLVPTTLLTTIEKALTDFVELRAVGEVLRTTSGNAVDWPTVNDTGNTGELLGENTAADDNDAKPTFAKLTLNAYKYSSKLLRVSYELFEDSAIDLNRVIGEILGERIGRKQAVDFTTGDGSSKPNGIVTASAAGVTAAATNAITFDELMGLVHAVDPAYRRDPSCGFMFHDNIALIIRKLKDGENRYLWEASTQVGQPDRLLGFPVTINQSMASSLAASGKPVLFGPMRYYKIRDVNMIRLRRLEERFADLDQVGFVAFMRSDADLLNPGVNPIRRITMAAS